MKKYFSLLTGLLTLGMESLVFLSLMELPPFGRGGSDIIWGLPFIGLIVFGLSVSGLVSAFSTQSNSQADRNLMVAGVILNGLSFALPVLVLMFGIGRALLLSGSLPFFISAIKFS